MNILITGCARFIGFHTSVKVLKKFNVIGLDSMNKYYDINLKRERLKILKKHKNFSFIKNDLLNINFLNKLFQKYKFKYVIHLAAQPGVRYSLKHPETYLKNNIISYFNIMQTCKKFNIKHFIFASTSSVYGDSKSFPTSEKNSISKPLSFYAATKVSNEVMCYSYSNIFKFPSTALRLFTVYGPFGRPDMALFKFTKKIISGKKIELFNKGKHQRDFSFIDDVADSIFKIILKPPKGKIPFRAVNIANGKSKKLKEYLKLLEKNLNIKSKIKKLPMQKGDVKKTHANIIQLKKLIKANPKTSIDVGVQKFVKWYRNFYK